jgi:tetratricopeptide (TPR) repeat protein
MQQQLILTADEVLEILEKEALAHDESLRNDLGEIAKSHKLAIGRLDDLDLVIPLLNYCAAFLRNKGIYVYFRIEENGNVYSFIAGECGRVIEEVDKLGDYLHALEWFIETNEHKLPPEVAAEKEKLDAYGERLCDEIYLDLLDAYIDNDKETIEAVIKEALKLVKEINDYLESIKYLQRIYWLEKSL